MRTKSAVVIMGINDTMMSYDLHIIDVVNNLKSRMSELSWMKLANKLMGLYNAPGALPLHELVFNQNKLEIVKLGKIDAPINELNYWDVIYSKRDEFMSKDIYDELCDNGFTKIIENTPVRFSNHNTLDFLSTFYNFVVLREDYKWSELPLLNHITFGDNPKQIIRWSKFGEWLDSQTERDQEDSLAILLTLVSPNEDIDKVVGQICLDSVPENKQELIACESRIITYNPRININKLKELSDNGTYNRSNMGIVKLFNPNMTSKR